MPKSQDREALRPAVPTQEGVPLHEAAKSAHAQGRSIYTCSVVVATTVGSRGMSVRGGKSGTRGQQWDPAQLIEAIETLGWRLEQIDHTWHQTEHNAVLGANALVAGITTAHMLFRRT